MRLASPFMPAGNLAGSGSRPTQSRDWFWRSAAPSMSRKVMGADFTETWPPRSAAARVAAPRGGVIRLGAARRRITRPHSPPSKAHPPKITPHASPLPPATGHPRPAHPGLGHQLADHEVRRDGFSRAELSLAVHVAGPAGVGAVPGGAAGAVRDRARTLARAGLAHRVQHVLLAHAGDPGYPDPVERACGDPGLHHAGVFGADRRGL